MIKKIKKTAKETREMIAEFLKFTVKEIKELKDTAENPEATEKEQLYAAAILYTIVNTIAYIAGYAVGYYLLGGEKRYYNRLKKKYDK